MQLTREIADLQPLILGRFVEELTELGVSLPKGVVESAARLGTLQRNADRLREHLLGEDLLGLDEAATDALLYRVAITEAIRSVRPAEGPAARAAEVVSRGIAEAVTVELRGRADEIIAQMATEFDPVAAAVHEATRAGITEATRDRDIVKADDPAGMAELWTRLPAQTEFLERVAQVRIGLTEYAGVAPRAAGSWNGARPTLNEQASAMFTTDGGVFHRPEERTWAKWVRLCTGGTVRLLTVAETEATWAAKVKADLAEHAAVIAAGRAVAEEMRAGVA